MEIHTCEHQEEQTQLTLLAAHLQLSKYHGVSLHHTRGER